MTAEHTGANTLAPQAPSTPADATPTVQVPRSMIAAAIVDADRGLTSYYPEEQREALSRLIEELGDWADGACDARRLAHTSAVFSLGELILRCAGEPQGARLNQFMAAFRGSTVSAFVTRCVNGLTDER